MENNLDESVNFKTTYTINVIEDIIKTLLLLLFK